jgi:hypothetical protein
MKFGIQKTFFGLKMKRNNNNKILMGVPRSGTTLACRLLCQMPDVIALNEPLESNLFPNREESLLNIEHSFAKFRSSLLEKGKAVARNREGQIVDNAYDSSNQKREMVLQRSEVFFNKELSSDFDLILKHNAGFTLLLPEIGKIFPCYALIRNPLAILGSWTSVNVPVSRGKVAKSKNLLEGFHQELATIEDLFERQIFILSWYFKQFESISTNNLIRYEELIKSNGNILQVIANREFDFNENLQNRNYNLIYDRDIILKLGERLLKTEGAYWKYYDKTDVINLLETYLNE